MVKYTPDQGDIVILSFDPQSSYEQKGRRPVMIIIILKIAGRARVIDYEKL